MSRQPKIKVPMDRLDFLLESIAALAFIALIILPLYYYNQLPESIPTHFDISGTPDRFDKKSSLFIIPMIGIFVYIFLHIIAKQPHSFNYGQTITEANAPVQYRIAVRLTRTIHALTMVLLLVISYYSIHIALKNIERIPAYLTWVFMFLIFGVVFYFLFKSRKNG